MNTLIELFHAFVLYLKSGQVPQSGLWAYVLLSVLVAIEGPIATLLGAGAASAGLMRPWYVFFAAAAGNLIADSLWYTLGYLGKIDWLYRFGKRIGLSPDLIEHLKHNMVKHATQVLFLAKLTVSFVIPSLITAGLLRLPLRRWLPALIFAETIWTGSLVLIGYYITEAIKRIEQGIEYAVLGGSILFVIFLIFAGRRLIKQWDQDTNQSDSQINP